ncbi:hypothetical protein [Nocardioides sp.]|uniref:hypothetical protein n=1 Tax=Nocardioides sp. TaxID=35761 RepID=UPI00286DF3A1|nr:hypothetical protein [Nocardioides sp.]
MSTLVVHESMWGNTRAVAEAVAARLGDDATIVEVGQAPVPLPADVDLLVVGGPTHAFSMSRSSTREDAVVKGAEPGHTARGIREWLGELPESDHVDVATFDTRVDKVRHLPGSAAKAAGKEVRRHHLGRLVSTESFYVGDMAGPLLDGELDRAAAWADTLSSRPVTR